MVQDVTKITTSFYNFFGPKKKISLVELTNMEFVHHIYEVPIIGFSENGNKNIKHARKEPSFSFFLQINMKVLGNLY